MPTSDHESQGHGRVNLLMCTVRARHKKRGGRLKRSRQHPTLRSLRAGRPHPAQKLTQRGHDSKSICHAAKSSDVSSPCWLKSQGCHIATESFRKQVPSGYLGWLCKMSLDFQRLGAGCPLSPSEKGLHLAAGHPQSQQQAGLALLDLETRPLSRVTVLLPRMYSRRARHRIGATAWNSLVSQVGPCLSRATVWKRQPALNESALCLGFARSTPAWCEDPEVNECRQLAHDTRQHTWLDAPG